MRNAVINQFNSIELRNDNGQLWENWFASERRKYLNNTKQKKPVFLENFGSTGN